MYNEQQPYGCCFSLMQLIMLFLSPIVTNNG